MSKNYSTKNPNEYGAPTGRRSTSITLRESIILTIKLLNRHTPIDTPRHSRTPRQSLTLPTYTSRDCKPLCSKPQLGRGIIFSTARLKTSILSFARFESYMEITAFGRSSQSSEWSFYALNHPQPFTIEIKSLHRYRHRT